MSISAFASLFGIPLGITSSAIGLKINAAFKTCNSLIKKKKKTHDKIALLAKSKLNSIEVLTSESLIDSVICHDEFILINDVIKEYNEIKEEIKNLKTLSFFRIGLYSLHSSRS